MSARTLINKPSLAARRVCLLTGALGAPAGIRRFLRLLPRKLPVAFVIVQNISPDAVHVLCHFLRCYSAMPVRAVQSGHMLKHGEITVIPSNCSVSLDAYGLLTVERDTVTNAMSADQVLTVFARQFRDQLGAIVFSGISEDGVMGCCEIVDLGGEVWTQSDKSCRYHSLPHYVARSCQVRYTASPEQLAARLLTELKAEPQQYARMLAG